MTTSKQFSCVGKRSGPLLLTDAPDTTFIGFPGEEGEAEIVRNMQMGSRKPVSNNLYGFSIPADPGDTLHDLTEYPGLTRHFNVNYSKLEPDGLPAKGTIYPAVGPNDKPYAIIGIVRVKPVGETKDENDYCVVYADNSITWNETRRGVVKNVIISDRGEDETIVKVIIDIDAVQTVGDKNSLPCGQKGVISQIFSAADAHTISHPDPFFSGLRCEYRFGLHGWTRMSKSLFWQISINWLALRRGELTRGTFGECIFDDEAIEQLHKEMIAEGIPPDCRFNVINPDTGIITRGVTLGWIDVVGQPHLANEKCSSVGTSKRHYLTRQPFNGAYRLGEMEIQALIAHGVARTIRERTLHSSDHFTMLVCPTCGETPMSTSKYCSSCKDCTPLCQIIIPYAAKLFFQELKSMGMNVYLSVEEEEVSLSITARENYVKIA